MDFVDGGYINKQQSDLRADRYIGANGQPITQYDGYFMDTIGFNWAPRENVTFTARVNNPLDHDGSESRYQTERSLAFIGRSVTTSLVVKF